jgi:hypothetical protein
MPGRVKRAPVVVVLDERLDLAFEILTATIWNWLLLRIEWTFTASNPS